MTDDEYQEAIIDLVNLVREVGAKTIWKELELSYQDVYYHLLTEALNQFKK